jgi:hypothetical protein
MDFRKFLAIGLAVGIAAYIIDVLVHGQLLADFYTHPPFRQGVNPGWMILTDFVAAFVFAWFYLAVAGSFAPGVSGGATMGFYTGVLLIFPAAILMYLMFEGFPYYLSWVWMFYTVAWYVCAGAIAGAINRN